MCTNLLKELNPGAISGDVPYISHTLDLLATVHQDQNHPHEHNDGLNDVCVHHPTHSALWKRKGRHEGRRRLRKMRTLSLSCCGLSSQKKIVSQLKKYQIKKTSVNHIHNRS